MSKSIVYRWLMLVMLVVVAFASGRSIASADSIAQAKGLAVSDVETQIRAFLEQQTRSLPGEVRFSIGPIPNPTLVRQCRSVELAAGQGARSYGRTRVSVKCTEGARWNVLVPVQISLIADYVVSARPIPGGQTLTTDDLSLKTGDLGELPDGIVTDLAQALGRIARINLSAGQPLRADLLKARLAVRSGQTVKIHSRGVGFSVTNEGVALNQGAVGEVIKVRLSGGQVISGTAKADGEVEIAF